MTIFTKAAAAATAVALAGAAAYTGAKIWKAAQGKATPASSTVVQDEAVAEMVADQVANWQVRYHDAALGTVEGTAIVDWDNRRAKVRLNQPAAGTSLNATLIADDVTVNQTKTAVSMRLRGTSPGGPRVVPTNVPGLKSVAAAAEQQLSVMPTEPSFSSVVNDKALPDTDGVRLTLQAQEYGALVGEWSYYADPITQRNGSGTGRVGMYRLLDQDQIAGKGEGFLGEQRSREEWWPLPTEILATMVMEEQLAAKTGLAEHPYPSGPAGPATERQRNRTLFVVGRYFPVDGGKVLREPRPSKGEKVAGYRVVAVSTDPDLDDKNRELMKAGWEKITQLLDPAETERVKENFDAALVVASLEEGVLPGPKQFNWGEGTRPWFLQFGDNLADARFVRRTQMKTAIDVESVDVFEQTPWIFLPEQIAIEIETRATLPIASVPVRIAVMSPPAGPKATAAGSPAAGAIAPGSPIVVHARQVPGRKNLYRTESFLVASTYAGRPLKPRDQLSATVQVDDVAFVAPPVAQALVLLTPDELAQRDKTIADARPKSMPELGGWRLPQDTSSSNVKLWKEALVLAARSDTTRLLGIPGKGVSIVDVTDFRKLPGTHLPSYSSIPMTVGDHAAMLLLRSAFLDMMRDRLQFLDSIKSDDDVEAFREWIRPFLERAPAPLQPSKEQPVGWTKYPAYLKVIEELNDLKMWVFSRPAAGVKAAARALDTRRDPDDTFGKGTYFGELPVPNPAGKTGVLGSGTWPFYRTYWTAQDIVFDPFFPDSRDIRMREWRLKATRSVIEQYRAAVASTIATTKATPDSDIRGLLKITGLSFGPVVNYVIPQLMRLEQSGGTARWVVDRDARAAVENLATFTHAVRLSEDFSSAAWSAPVSIVSDLLQFHSMGLVNLGKSLPAIAGWGLLAWQAGTEISEQIAVRRDLDFFFGASAVIGADTLDEVNARKATIADVLEGLAAQFALESVWGELKQSTGPVYTPSGSARWLPSFEIALHAANDPIRPPVRVRSKSSQLRSGLRILNAERALAGKRPLSMAQLKQLGKPTIQAVLQIGARGGAKIDNGRPVARVHVRAVGNANQLNNALNAPPGAVQPPPKRRKPPAAPQPPPAANKALPGGPLPVVTPPEPPGPYVAMLRKLRAYVTVPLPGLPALDGSWIAIVEVVKQQGKDAAQWFLYKTEGLNPSNPGEFKSGVSSDVAGITKVMNRSTTTREGGRVTGELLFKELDGKENAVIKLLKDSEAKGFGNARDQCLRIKEAHENLVKAAGNPPSIEFPEILEFHPDAIPPYIIQKRVKFRPGEIEQVSIWNLVNEIPPNSEQYFLKPWNEIDKAFPLEKRRAYVELHAELGRRGVIGTDLSLPNVYFRKIGGRWVAGILDIDHLMLFEKPPAASTPHVTWDWMDGLYEDPELYTPSVVHDGRDIFTDPLTFMEKALEMKWGGNANIRPIRFSRSKSRFDRGFIEPELVAQVFRRFKTRLPKPTPAPRKQVSLDRLLPIFRLPMPLPDAA